MHAAGMLRAVPNSCAKSAYSRCYRASLSNNLPVLQAYMEETQRHDFCVSSELSIALAHKTASILHGG